MIPEPVRSLIRATIRVSRKSVRLPARRANAAGPDVIRSAGQAFIALRCAHGSLGTAAPSCNRALLTLFLAMTLRKPLSLLAPLAATALLTACATPGTPDASPRPAADDPINRHALVRQTTPAPAWPQLRQTLDEATRNAPGITVGAASAQGIKIEIPVADGFASGSTVIRPSLAAALDSIAPALAGEPGVAVKIVGHTDSQGSEMVNLRLSIDRAEAVVAYLAGRGIALERLSADGRGEADPLTSNATEEGRARNRRVELLLRAMN